MQRGETWEYELQPSLDLYIQWKEMKVQLYIRFLKLNSLDCNKLAL